MAFSFRLDPQTEASIRRLAKATGRSRSAVVRDAVAQYSAAETRTIAFPRTTLDRLSAFAGLVSTGGQFSTDTHTKFRLALTRKHRGRRSR